VAVAFVGVKVSVWDVMSVSCLFAGLRKVW